MIDQYTKSNSMLLHMYSSKQHRCQGVYLMFAKDVTVVTCDYRSHLPMTPTICTYACGILHTRYANLGKCQSGQMQMQMQMQVKENADHKKLAVRVRLPVWWCVVHSYMCIRATGIGYRVEY